MTGHSEPAKDLCEATTTMSDSGAFRTKVPWQIASEIGPEGRRQRSLKIVK
jgi:hypothetical protein